jgi:hypothetical protein
VLDEQVIALARKTAAPQLRDLDRPLAQRATAKVQKFHQYGHLKHLLMELYGEEVARRADVIWRNLHRAHTSLSLVHAEGLAGDLLAAFRVDLEVTVKELLPKLMADLNRAHKFNGEPDWVAQLNAARDHELARYEAEIDHYVASLAQAKARGAAPQASYVIHGNVGAVMTGAGAVAHVVQNIGVAQRDELLRALEMVKQAIAQAPEIVERDRTELAELADEASAEVTKDKPNAKRLALTLQTLAATVQGIANGPAAYEVLRAAAVAIGIAL